MSLKSEAKAILKNAAKGFLTIPFHPPKEKPQEEIKLHYCEKCKKYHRAP